MSDKKLPKDGWTVFRKSDDEVFGRGLDRDKIDLGTLALIGLDACPDYEFDYTAIAERAVAEMDALRVRHGL